MLHDLLKELHDKSLDHLEQLKFEKGRRIFAHNNSTVLRHR